jgi:uncharacterized repeat protein (TIGR03803 family)
MAEGIQKLADFNGANGSRSYAGLTLGTNGLFYGTTQAGGSSDQGTLFSFNPTGNVLTSAANFDGINGAYPGASLYLGTDGLFYGTTNSGGSSNLGTIFSFNPTGNVLTSLSTFNGANGSIPLASLTLGTDGLFYGTTSSGGSFGKGTIFSFNPTGNVLTSLSTFNGANGSSPLDSLTLGTDSLFYGTTQYDGSFGRGTIFSFNPTGNVLTSLASFDVINGAYPSASLSLGTDGFFYGTTDSGGSSDWGTLFSFNPTGNVLTSLASFDGNNGIGPLDSLTLGTDGFFYGTTDSGGSSDWGTLFSFNPTGNVLTSLASFDGANGAFSSASLTLGTDGLFYGTTQGGGTSDAGTIFSFDPNSSTPVPEPSALLGTTIAVALGATLKRKSAHKHKQ